MRVEVPGVAPLDVTFITPTSFRIRSAEPDPQGDAVPEYMIVKADTSRVPVSTTVTREGASTVIATDAVRVRVTPSSDGTLEVTVTNARGEEVVRRWRLDPLQRTMQLALRPDERVYGFGDKRAALDQRGHTVDMINRDAFASTTNASYKSIPFYFSDRGYGLFFHNFYPSRFEVGVGAAPNDVRVVTSGGRLDAYVFVGEQPRDIVAAYTELTGRPAMLPRWALGYHQGKASYQGAEAMNVAGEMRRRKLPFDAIFYDDWSDNAATPRFSQQVWDRYQARLTMGGNPFLIGDSDTLRRMGRNRQLLSHPDGRPVIEPACEVANDEGKSDDVAYVDFFSPAAGRAFLHHEWAKALKPGTVNRGGSREPAVYLGMADFGEMDHLADADRKRWPSNGMPAAQSRNVYALAYATGLVGGAQEITGHRSTGMIRPGFAGTQRFGWTTTGDSTPDYENFRAHLRGMLSLTHSGFSNVGQDIGGWDHKGPDDVYARWFGAATFFPFMWSHGQGDHEPYVHGPQVEAAARSFLELRYRMLPYVYSLHEQAHRTGVPAVRSMMFQDMRDPVAARVDDQFYLGEGLLVAPLFHRTQRELYLPAGTWYDFFGGAPLAGGRRIQRNDVPLDRIPAYVKAGSIIPMGPVVQREGENPSGPLTVHYYAHPSAEVGAGRDSTFELYEDDGVTQRYRQGAFARTALRFTQEQGVIRFQAERIGGDRSYQPAIRQRRVRLHGVTPRRVFLGTTELPRGGRAGQSYWDGDTVVLAPSASGVLTVEH